MGTQDDPFGGRQPTSHERMTGKPWDASYRDGPAPWQIGHPQGAVVRLAAAGKFSGSVLDAGCGSGENALLIASLGLDVLGVDVAETALAMARETALRRGLKAEFRTADAFQLGLLGRVFDTVLDCGLFHTFEEDEQAEYVAGLAAVTRPGGMLYVVCFADEGQDVGPHPVSRQTLQRAFGAGTGWEVLRLGFERVETNFHPGGVAGWLVEVKRI